MIYRHAKHLLISSGSIIILSIDSFLQLLKGRNLEHAVLEANGDIILVSEQLHYEFLAAAFESGLIAEGKTEVSLVEFGSAFVLLFSCCPLVLHSHFTEEVVAVEQPIGPHSHTQHPNWANASQPPGVGLGNEVRVVKHT